MKNFIVWIIYLIFVNEFIFNSICYKFVYYYDKRIINEFGFDSIRLLIILNESKQIFA